MNKSLSSKILIMSLSILHVLILSSCTKDSSKDLDHPNISYESDEIYEPEEIHESFGDYGVGDEPSSNEKDIVINHPQIGMDDFELSKEINPESYSKNGVIKIFKNNAIKPEDDTSAKVTVDFFFDPVCPASSAYNKMLHDELKKELESGQVELRYRVTPYLNEKTLGDYSNRASSYILAVSEYAPSYSQLFINALLSSKFQPSSPASKYASDDLFLEAMRSVGIDNDKISKVEANKDNFVPVAIASANDFVNEGSKWMELSRWKDESGNQIVYTPFVLVNKAGSYGRMALKVHSVNPRNELRNEVNKVSR